MNETATSSHVQVAAASLNILLMRNNVGVAVDETGRHIRYGLMNESKKVNDQFKSSDLIGVTPVLIGPQHVGRVMGIFTALETKRAGWTLRPGDTHAQAQIRFLDLVKRYGAIGGIVTDPRQLAAMLGAQL